MRVCIHRGAHEIGGSCVEVEHHSARLVLDAGLALGADSTEDEPLPPVTGLADGDSSIVGILVSHGHPDHYGLVTKAHPLVPLYVGEGDAADPARGRLLHPRRRRGRRGRVPGRPDAA